MSKKVTVGVGHHDCTFAYPGQDDFVAAGKNVIARLTGDTSIDNACMVHCTWVCAGFAASFIPHDHPEVHSTQEEGLEQLKAAVKSADTDPTTMKAINWAAVGLFLWNLFLEWAKKQ